jgi:ABC-type transporter Mla subunit MlaD
MRRALAIALSLIAVAAVVLIPSATGADDGPYKVRAIFDNGGFIVNDEEVRVAGATVGTVESVDITSPDEIASLEGGPHPVPGKAVVVMNITDDAFKDFREDASCIIRPQSLIGEKLVDCTPTQPRAVGEEPPPELEQIEEGPGEGQRLLPLENNGKAVDLDLIQNINRVSYRDRFRLILNDLGAALAARGDDLAAVVDRSNPALRQTNRVLKILADQSDQLDSLASDGDAVLQPLAENREHVTGFFANAAVAGQATAERGDDLEAQLEKFPETLRQVRATMKDLRGFADEGTPLAEDVAVSAPWLSKATQKLGPFASAGIPALKTLGTAVESAGPKLIAADPVVVDLRELTDSAAPSAKNLQGILNTLSETNGFKYLMDFIYGTSGSVNGFDEFGHYQRGALQVTACVRYEAQVFSGCEANFSAFQPITNASSAKKKKKKKSAAAGALRTPQPELEPLPPEAVEELPELEPAPPETTVPDDPEEPDVPTGEGDAGSQPDADADAADGRQAGASGRSAHSGADGSDQLTIGEAALLLQFLLGGPR